MRHIVFSIQRIGRCVYKLNIAKNVANETASVAQWGEARGVSGLEVISG